MKFLIVFAVVIACAVAAPPAASDAQAQVISETNEINPDGSYSNR